MCTGFRYQRIGRKHVLAGGAVTAVLPLLWSRDLQVRVRAAGVVHNLSSDETCVKDIRTNEGIPVLLTLLKDQSIKVVSAAAGAIQNVARDVESRREILAVQGSIRLLGSLLFKSDTQCQAFAVGALINLLTPNLQVPMSC